MTILQKTIALPGFAAKSVDPRKARLLRFLSCSGAGLLNFGGTQVIRLGGNLILTRMLAPEAFGLMALINVFLIGLKMVSDLGIGPSIIRRQEPLTEAFLGTAWTLQVIRGWILFAIVCAIAYPLSRFYAEPSLLWLIPVVGSAQAILGFRSVSFFIEEKKMNHFGPTLLNLGSALAGLLVAIVLAQTLQSVWALVWSAVVAAVLNVAGSFAFLPHCRLRIRWDAASGKELVRFGKWITLSTAIAFLGTQGDRLILGKWLTMEELGIYTVAFFFAQSVTSLLSGTGNRVLLPMLSRSDFESREEKRNTYNRSRAAFVALAAPLLALFAAAGSPFIQFLYDARYADAGPMLEILALGAMTAVLRSFFQPLMLSHGDAFRRMILSTAETVFLLLGMIIGGTTFGLPGFLWGWVGGQALSYAFGLCLVRKYRLHNLIPDLALILLVLASKQVPALLQH